MENREAKGGFRRAWEAVERAFVAHTGFIFLLFGFNFFTAAWSFALAEDTGAMLLNGCALLLVLTLLTAALARFLRPPWLARAKNALLLLFFVPFAVEAFVMYTYQARIGAGIVNSMLETNLKEAVEFLRMYVGWRELGAAAFAAALCCALRRLWRRRAFALSARAKRGLLRALAAAGAVSLAWILPACAGFFAFELVPAARLVSATSLAVDNAAAYRRLAAQIDADIHLTENSGEIPNIVFILGESTNRNHMHLYGYYLPNTPHFDEMLEKGEIAVYRDVISPHSTTVEVLSELFTFCGYESERPWYAYHNLIDVMNAAGYKTYWLSNQESSGIWGSVAQLYANRSAVHRFTRLRDSTEDEGVLDEALFPLLDEALAQPSADKNFYVLHLMGGHGLYYNRYPYRFHRFTDEDIRLEVAKKFKEIVAQYDNALYYNDYVVSELIDRFRNREALVLYVPDHGEAVYDEGGSVAGHIEENPSRHMIEIPMIVWASPSFRARWPEKWDAIAAGAARPYRSDDMIHTVLDLADIRTEEWRADKSVVNEAFDAARPRFFGEENYDTQIRAAQDAPHTNRR